MEFFHKEVFSKVDNIFNFIIFVYACLFSESSVSIMPKDVSVRKYLCLDEHGFTIFTCYQNRKGYRLPISRSL